MILLISKFLQKILPHQLIKYLKRFFYYLKYFQLRKYNLGKDLTYNEKILSELNINTKNIKKKLNNINLDYNDQSLSWHYQIFCGLNDYFSEKKIEIKNILEIGTFDGKFSNFLSKIYPNAKITTIDLKEDDQRFKESYSRNNINKRNIFLKKRSENLNKKNINFIEMDSTNIKEYFKKIKFEMIWVDGDHLDPQVSIDIINSLELINQKSVICVDDVMLYEDEFKRIKNCTNESYKTLKKLEIKNKITNFYILKRISKSNAEYKKYISISLKK